MPSMFRNVIRSRRKQKQGKSTSLVYFSGFVTKQSDSNKHSSPDHSDHCKTRKNLPQQQTLKISQTSDEEDESLHEGYPSRNRTAYHATPKNSNNKAYLLSKSLRRKSRHDTKHHTKPGVTTPDTVDSKDYDLQQSSSNHERSQFVKERKQNLRQSRSDNEQRSSVAKEIPKRPNGKEGSFHTPERKPKEFIEHTRNRGSNAPVTCISNAKPPSQTTQDIPSTSGNIQPTSWRNDDSPDTKLKPVKLSLQFDKDCERPKRTSFRTTKDRINTPTRTSGNTKTVIMNGDIVVCNAYNNDSSGDTITLTSSASSNSRARAMQRESERNARAATALDEKGNELFEKGYFDKAMACYTKALKLKRRTFAHLLKDSDDLEEELLLRDDNGNLDPQALVSMATSINNIGYLRQRSGDATPEETMAAYKKSLKIKRRILGNDSLSVGKTLNNIGSVHYLKRDFERALSAYDEALEIMKANLGEKHPDVATVMSNIGDVYLGQNDKEASVKYYRLALVIRWEAFGEKSPRVVRLLEKISNLEIGDMPGMRSSQKSQTTWGDDVASEILAGSDFQPISESLKLLHEQIRNEIEQVDRMERNAAVELLKDKIIIIRGMRDAWNGNGSGPELLDNDCASVQTAMSRLSTKELVN